MNSQHNNNIEAQCDLDAQQDSNEEALAALVAEAEYCKRCDQYLHPKRTVWLEMTIGHKYAVAGVIPEAKSQGFFAFGKCCADKMLRTNPYIPA